LTWLDHLTSSHDPCSASTAVLQSKHRSDLRVRKFPAPGHIDKAVRAGVAQLVEHLICNQRVGGSNPFVSSTLFWASAFDAVSGGLDSGKGFGRFAPQSESSSPLRSLSTNEAVGTGFA
jgi:hypothetical protein